MKRKTIKFLVGLVALQAYISGCSSIGYNNSARSVLTPETKNKIALCTGGLSQNIGATIKGKLDSNNVSIGALIGDEVKGLFQKEGSDEKYRIYVDCIKTIQFKYSSETNFISSDLMPNLYVSPTYLEPYTYWQQPQ